MRIQRKGVVAPTIIKDTPEAMPTNNPKNTDTPIGREDIEFLIEIDTKRDY